VLKSFFLTILLFVASTLLIAEATLRSPLLQRTRLAEVSLSSQLLAQGTEFSEAANDAADVSDHPEQPADDTIVESDSSPAVSASSSTYPQPPHPYNVEAIEEFDEELYGEGS
jgi:hypothetical protein